MSMSWALVSATVAHALFAALFTISILCDVPALPLFRYPLRTLLAPLPIFLILLPLPISVSIPIVTAYSLAILHHARVGPLRTFHAYFLIGSGILLLPLLNLALVSIVAGTILLVIAARQQSVAVALPEHQPISTQAEIPPDARRTSAASLTVFSWIRPVIALGHRRPLESSDVAPLAPPLRSFSAGGAVFAPKWEAELERSRGPSLWRALARSFGVMLLPGACFRALNDVCKFISPLILRRIILILQGPHDVHVAKGYILALLMLLTCVAQSLFWHHSFNNDTNVQIKLRAALIDAIFAKSCRLSSRARAQFSSGSIQNLMATDSRTVAELTQFLNMLWSSGAQIIVSLALLVNLLGWIPTAIGTFVLVISIPVEKRLVTATKLLREAASGCTDVRVKASSEAILGIKIVKLYAWELSFIERIVDKRKDELSYVRQTLFLSAWNTVLSKSIPTVLSIFVFSAYALIAGRLDAASVFPAIAIFNILRLPMNVLPWMTVSCARAAASVSRIQRFFLAEELNRITDDAHHVEENRFTELAVDFVAEGANFLSQSESDHASQLSLTNVTMRIPSGALVCVVGSTGGGKSTLLAALLGEVPILSGRAGIRPGRSVSLADQVPFIQNGTIRDNILFGRSFDLLRYRRAIQVCCLSPDLLILPGGDLTEIGSRGTNLSGGQRSRVSMARVVYANADIAFLDDPLCAVDAHVGRSMFEKCIAREMRGKTRVMTTNQIHFATSASVDFVAVVENGSVVEFGRRSELLGDRTSAFSQLAQNGGSFEDASDAHDHGSSGEMDDDSPSECDLDNFARDAMDGIVVPSQHPSRSKRMVQPSANEKTPLLSSKREVAAIDSGRLVREEGKDEGRVKFRHYRSYMESAGGLRSILFIAFLSITTQAVTMMVSFWLSIWSDNSQLDHQHLSVWFYLTVYIVLGVAAIVGISLTAFAIAYSSIRASVALHENLLLSVFGAPLSWFTSNPGGRITNRFNSDIDKVDSTLPNAMQSFFNLALQLLGALCLILYATPWFLVVVIPVSAIFLYVQEFYRKSSVDLRRLEGLARSPLYSHFEEVLDGVRTIRVFGMVPREALANQKYADSLNRITYSSTAANRWLGVRLEFLGSILIFATACFSIAASGKVTAGLTGLVLAYSMQLLGYMTFSVRSFTEMESQMSAVERIAEYSTSPPFPQEEEGGMMALLNRRAMATTRHFGSSRGLISSQLSKLFAVRSQRRRSWPRRGRIEFKNITMRYRSDLDPALRGVSLSIAPGEHIGIVGRTGAGKSSLLSVLFRLNEFESGSISIDGVDISTMNLFDLRSSLGVIPQEPYCFSGTIRSNLDMFNEYDDASVQDALDGCGLAATMGNSVSLDFEVQENGQNLSVGQRQLLCLGRALLRNSQILVLDEATSSVSNDTDEKIQSTLRAEMGKCTVLTVAHRLHTVMTSDRIVVMDGGRIAEVGRPCDLLDRADSKLSGLVDETGASTAAYLRQIVYS